MSAEENKALYHRLLVALNRNDLDAASALMAPNAVNHNDDGTEGEEDVTPIKHRGHILREWASRRALTPSAVS